MRGIVADGAGRPSVGLAFFAKGGIRTRAKVISPEPSRGRAAQQAFSAQVFVELGPMDAVAAARAALHSSHGHTSRRNCQE
jgi:hypothetical protein